MKKIEEYCKSLGMEEIFIGRTKEIVSLIKNINDGEILDFFITNIFDSENKQKFENLWLFSESHMIEVKEFIFDTKFDIAKIDIIDYIEFSLKDFNFIDVNDKSRFSIYGRLREGVNFSIKASGNNCKKLFEIYNTQLKNRVFKK